MSAVRGVAAAGVYGAGTAAIDAAVRAAGAGRRGRAGEAAGPAGEEPSEVRRAADDGGAASRGSGGEPQASRAAVAAAGPATAGAAKTTTKSGISGVECEQLHGSAGDDPERRMGVGLRARPDGGRTNVPVADADRRVHAGVPDPVPGPIAPGSGSGAGTGEGGGPTGRAEGHPQRQRVGVHRRGDPGMADGETRRDLVHRPGQSVGERLRGVVPQSAAGRVPERRAVRDGGGGEGESSGLADGLQHAPPAQQPGVSDPAGGEAAFEFGRCGVPMRSESPHRPNPNAFKLKRMYRLSFQVDQRSGGISFFSKANWVASLRSVITRTGGMPRNACKIFGDETIKNLGFGV